MLAGITLLWGSYFQFLHGIHGPHHGNTVPANNFGVYGAFWLSLAIYRMADPTGGHLMLSRSPELQA